MYSGTASQVTSIQELIDHVSALSGRTQAEGAAPLIVEQMRRDTLGINKKEHVGAVRLMDICTKACSRLNWSRASEGVAGLRRIRAILGLS